MRTRSDEALANRSDEPTAESGFVAPVVPQLNQDPSLDSSRPPQPGKQHFEVKANCE